MEQFGPQIPEEQMKKFEEEAKKQVSEDSKYLLARYIDGNIYLGKIKEDTDEYFILEDVEVFNFGISPMAGVIPMVVGVFPDNDDNSTVKLLKNFIISEKDGKDLKLELIKQKLMSEYRLQIANQQQMEQMIKNMNGSNMTN